MRSTTTFTDRYGKSIHAYHWVPDSGTPKAVLQISHGMAEHSARYDEFADFLNEHGIAVFSHDHRGHGLTDPDHLGYVSDDDGFQLQVENIDDAKQEIKKLYPNIPRFLFGHSMGSFVVQRYMQLFSDQSRGIIYSGSNGKPPITLSLGIAFAWLVTKIQGEKKPSTILRDLIFVPYNKRFKPNRTDKDWLNRNEDEVDNYIQDPMAGYVCTGSFFYDFLNGLKSLHTHRPFADHDKEIPILLIAGGEDAVSDFGKGIRNLEQLLRDSGVQNVETKIYPGARHEVLKELNKEEVLNDVLSWIYQQLGK